MCSWNLEWSTSQAPCERCKYTYIMNCMMRNSLKQLATPRKTTLKQIVRQTQAPSLSLHNLIWNVFQLKNNWKWSLLHSMILTSNIKTSCCNLHCQKSLRLIHISYKMLVANVPPQGILASGQAGRVINKLSRNARIWQCGLCVCVCVCVFICVGVCACVCVCVCV